MKNSPTFRFENAGESYFKTSGSASPECPSFTGKSLRFSDCKQRTTFPAPLHYQMCIRDSGYIVYHPLPKRPEVLAIEGNAYWVTSDKGEGTISTFGRDVSTRIRHEQQIKQFNQILDRCV